MRWGKRIVGVVVLLALGLGVAACAASESDDEIAAEARRAGWTGKLILADESEAIRAASDARTEIELQLWNDPSADCEALSALGVRLGTARLANGSTQRSVERLGDMVKRLGDVCQLSGSEWSNSDDTYEAYLEVKDFLSAR